jgi:hypothetical protein
MIRIGLLVTAGLLLTACSSPPSYTVQDAIKAMNASQIKANRDPRFNACYAKYLFQHVSPAEVKTIVNDAVASESQSEKVMAEGAEVHCVRYIGFK